MAFSTIGWADSHDGGTAVAVIPGSTDVLYGGFFGNSGTGSPTADFEMADGTTTSLAGPSGGGYQRQFAWFGRRQTNGKWVWVNGWRESGSDEISLAVSGDGAQGYVAGSWRPTNLTSGDDPIAGVSDFAFLGPNTSNVSLPFGLLAAADGFDYGAPQVTGMLAGFDPPDGQHRVGPHHRHQEGPKRELLHGR